MNNILSGDKTTIGDAVRSTAETVQEAGQQATSAISEATKSMCSFSMKARDNLTRTVEAQPVASVVLAAALGLMAGLFLSRSSRR